MSEWIMPWMNGQKCHRDWIEGRYSGVLWCTCGLGINYTLLLNDRPDKAIGQLVDDLHEKVLALASKDSTGGLTNEDACLLSRTWRGARTNTGVVETPNERRINALLDTLIRATYAKEFSAPPATGRGE